MTRAIRPALGLLLALALTACTSIYRNHGYVPPDRALNALDVGVTTRAEVASAVGRPSSAGLLEESGWYYVQSRFRHFGWREPKEVDREVVAISFGPDDTLSNIERFGLEEGRVVALSRRVTESNVQGVSFLRQLFGNIGNIQADQLVN